MICKEKTKKGSFLVAYRQKMGNLPIGLLSLLLDQYPF